jgi:shikimate dehydrogenase
MVDTKTRVFAVIGNPIEHSLSPLIHNAAFSELNLNNVYVAFKVSDVRVAIGAMKELGFGGYSVTIPHKIEVMKYLNEIDSLAKKIGAVNTVINTEGKLVGYNTDVFGAIDALREKADLRGKNVYVLGAGGVARAIVAGLVEEKAVVTIFNIVPADAEKLANEFNCKWKEWSAIDSNCEVLINATSVGMSPNIDSMPIDAKLLKKEMLVFDVVYNPLETKLVKEAKKIGCTAIPGVEMFLGQAYAQVKLFTGKDAPKQLMKKLLLKELEKMQSAHK